MKCLKGIFLMCFVTVCLVKGYRNNSFWSLLDVFFIGFFLSNPFVEIKTCGEACYIYRCVLPEGNISFAFLSSANTPQTIGFIVVAIWLRVLE